MKSFLLFLLVQSHSLLVPSSIPLDMSYGSATGENVTPMESRHNSSYAKTMQNQVVLSKKNQLKQKAPAANSPAGAKEGGTKRVGMSEL